jgi:hypothetical protein
MGFQYPIGKHVKKGMIVRALQNGILKLNHLLSNELFKWRKTHMFGLVEDHMSFSGVAREEMCCHLVIKFQEGKDVDQQ